MVAIEAAWLIGAHALEANATIVVGGNNVVITAADRYLYDATDAINLIKAIETGIAAVYAGSTVRVLKNRLIKIDLNGNSATLEIPAALRAVLGFTTGSYTAATSHTAEDISTLLWSGGWPETTIGHPVGTVGYEVYNREHTESASGLTSYTTLHGTEKILTELFFDKVSRERVWTPEDSGGTFHKFRAAVLIPGYRWKLYSGMTEDAASISAVTWTTALGPYKLRDPAKWWSRSIPSVDVLSPITVKGTLTGEIS